MWRCAHESNVANIFQNMTHYLTKNEKRGTNLFKNKRLKCTLGSPIFMFLNV